MKSNQTFKSAGIVSVLTMLSRITGLFRDMCMACLFGTEGVMSAFVIAYRIPNLFRALFGEGALSAAFVPVFTETLKKDGPECAFLFASRALSIIFVILSVIAGVGIIIITFCKLLGIPNEESLLIWRLTQILLPYMVFICSAALLAAILNSLGKFALPASTQLVYNMTIVLLAFFLLKAKKDQEPAIVMIAWGSLFAVSLQFIMQLPPLIKRGFRLGASIDFKDPYILKAGSLMSISAIGMGASRINALVDTLLAKLISESAPSYLYFADRLIYLPLGIFATALGTVLLPAFSTYASANEPDKIRSSLGFYLRNISFLMIPSAIGLIALAKPIISSIFQTRNFTSSSTNGTALALICYSTLLIFTGLTKVFVPGFYALQDMKTPLKIGLCSTILNLMLSVTLMFPFKYAGIASATVIAAIANAIMLAIALHKRLGSPGWSDIISGMVRQLLAGIVMGYIAYITNRFAIDVFPGSIPMKLAGILALLLAIIVGATIYILLALLLGATEPRELLG
ncbi:MAG: murein biosynthesis integral membrane protein MurJ, partial [Lentisphaerae bacterium]|nr:murein biosynthesis integral membrane protein MurJ [Lentisphaerota bacterium]